MMEYIEACKQFNIKPGIFYSTQMNNYNGWGKGAPIGPVNFTMEQQDEFCVQQLTELFLGKYGDLFELWLDGGISPNLNKTRQWLQEHGTKFVTHGFPELNGIRWVGDETGNAPIPSWSATMWTTGSKGRADPQGNIYYPSSADTVLRQHCWGWVNNSGT